MLRFIILFLVIYLVIRIGLRLLLTESPTQRRARMNSRQNASRYSDTSKRDPASRFEHVEDADFEEIPGESTDKKP